MPNAEAKRTTGRYRNLRSGVRSFAEGFTGILSGGFESLAAYRASLSRVGGESR